MNKKRRIIIVPILVLTLIALAITLTAAIRHRKPGDISLVDTSEGTLRGSYVDGVYAYLGVDYGEADKRFTPAKEPDTWEGVRDAAYYGNTSPQGGIFGEEPDDYISGDNNCLNLNIWTPAPNDNSKRPVMVWFHGGGFSIGSGNEEAYNGANLARDEDVVVITVNHRLNVYGFLDLSEYGENYKYSANLGLYDLIDALKWIRENVDSFGGDPDNITIFGQSGGGGKVIALMTSPYAKGLFDKAIVQSGASDVQGAVFTSKEVSRYITLRILEELNITKDNIDALQVIDNKTLQQASTKALGDAAIKYKIPVEVGDGYALEWQPVVDGDFLPANPDVGSTFTNASKNVPLLIGSNLEEWAYYSGITHYVDSDIISEFHRAYPNEDTAIAKNTDTIVRQPTLKLIKKRAGNNKASVYAYVYTYQSTDDGASHGTEIPYVFRNAPVDNPMTDMMSTLWTSFARDGVPSYPGMTQWKPYTLRDGATMILDEEPYLTYNHDERLLELLRNRH